MKIHDLIDHFSSFTSIPIDPNDVAKQIKSAGIRDEISFVEVDIDFLILRGAIHTYVSPNGVYAQPDICSDIYYAKGQTRAWKRLVCIKELLHMLDSSISKTSSPDDFSHLVKGLCSKPNYGAFDADGLQVWRDRLMVYYAIAIVFPAQARSVLTEAWLPEGMSLTAFATEQLDIPEEVAALVLSDRWPDLLKSLYGSK